MLGLLVHRIGVTDILIYLRFAPKILSVLISAPDTLNSCLSKERAKRPGNRNVAFRTISNSVIEIRLRPPK